MSSLLQAVVKNLRERFADNLVAVALFGSAARGEAGERSDLDFLVVLRRIPKALQRRYEVYKPIHDAAAAQSGPGTDVTVIDLDEEFITNQDVEITSLMLNITADASIVYDPDGKLASFFGRVRRLVDAAGLERYKTKEGKYGWKPRDGVLRAVEA
jgi:predicted nucleotidyltransferase